MIYILSCFFRDLADLDPHVASPRLDSKLRSLDRIALAKLRDCALDLARVVELAIGVIDESSEPCGDCGQKGEHHCPAWCDNTSCEHCRPELYR